MSERLDTVTAAGRLVVTALAALAQLEREQVRERTAFAARSGRSSGESAEPEDAVRLAYEFGL